MTFYNCKKAEYVGTLNQYDKNTMSRSDIDKNPAIINKIKSFTGFVDTITFKKYGNLLSCIYLFFSVEKVLLQASATFFHGIR